MRRFVGSRGRPVSLRSGPSPVRVRPQPSLESSMSSVHARLRGLVAVSALVLGASVLTACDNGDDLPGAGAVDDSAGAQDGSSPGSGDSSGPSDDGDDDAPAGSISTNIKKKSGVPVSTLLEVSAQNGR